ncbi:site-specific integrase [Actinocatenispora sera]|uniref:Site-specific integrase n=1 Tax=Actinocatenispora sera TaxID=390989 RepID=A0A810L0V1_9ACTN|nr:site-specific integrase [Actinocatenispora sera]BCJ28282.1 site-specific integrase [Actinocatenispora sera]
MKGHVYKRGKTYTYMFDGQPDPLTGDRKQISKGGWKTETIAWQKCREAMQQVESGKYAEPSKRTVEEFLVSQWLPVVRRTVAASTWASWRHYTTSNVVPAIGKVRMQDLTAVRLHALYEHLLTTGRVKRTADEAMFGYWTARQKKGEEPKPREVMQACGVTIHAARAAVRRYRAGRTPKAVNPGLDPKTVRNIHAMLHKALTDALAWHYVTENVAASVKPPRVPKRRRPVWTPKQLGTFLAYARTDRFYALYLVVATTGMRRAEVCGLTWSAVDIEAGHLAVDPGSPRVVVDGRAETSDGKTDNAPRLLSLDKVTVDALREWRTVQRSERPFYDEEYDGTDLLFTWEDGRPIHPDVVRQRFHRMAAACGLPRIRLHDVRHSYATAALKAGVHPAVVSRRLGHASEAFTMSVYTHVLPGMDRDAADTIANLILPPDEAPEPAADEAG